MGPLKQENHIFSELSRGPLALGLCRQLAEVEVIWALRLTQPAFGPLIHPKEKCFYQEIFKWENHSNSPVNMEWDYRALMQVWPEIKPLLCILLHSDLTVNRDEKLQIN